MVAPVRRTFAPEPPPARIIEKSEQEPDVKLFAPEGSAEGCASGECLPGEEPQAPSVAALPSVHPERSVDAVDAKSTGARPIAPIAALASVHPERSVDAVDAKSKDVRPIVPIAVLPSVHPERSVDAVDAKSKDVRPIAPIAAPIVPPTAVVIAAPPDDDAQPALSVALPLAERWARAVDAVRAASPRLGKSLSVGRIIALKDGEARIAFPTDAGFHRATVFGASRPEIEAALSRKLGVPTRLAEEKSEAAFAAAGRSVSESEADAKFSRERTIEARVRQSSAVLSVLNILGGTLEHVQVLDAGPSLEHEAPVAPDDDA